MERLTIKEFAPYLPYGLKMISSDGRIGELIGLIETDSIIKRTVWDSGCREMGIEAGNDIKISRCCLNAENMGTPNKPLLRPLSSFVSYFSKLFDDDIDVRTFLNEGLITQENQFSDLDDMLFNYKIEWWPYGVIQLALKHHFDVFGLIDKGLALPIDGKEVEGNG